MLLSSLCALLNLFNLISQDEGTGYLDESGTSSLTSNHSSQSSTQYKYPLNTHQRSHTIINHHNVNNENNPNNLNTVVHRRKSKHFFFPDGFFFSNKINCNMRKVGFYVADFYSFAHCAGASLTGIIYPTLRILFTQFYYRISHILFARFNVLLLPIY